jgi:hypothetical protein
VELLSGGCARALALLALAAFLASCGGGGDGGNSGGGSSNRAGLEVSTSTVELSADAAILGTPTATFTITVTNPPRDGVAIGGSHSENAIVAVSLEATAAATGTVTIFFQEPGILGAGVYEDEIQIGICTDDSCTALVGGTQRSVRTRYTVTGTAPALSVTPSTRLVTVQAVPFTLAAPSAIVRLTLDGIPTSQVNVETEYGENGIANASLFQTDEVGFDLEIIFKSPVQTGIGIFEDTVTVSICRMAACTPLNGSPVVIATRYEVSETISGENGYTIRQVDVTAVDLVWDESSGNIYLSSPSSAPQNPNSIVALNPATAELGNAAFAGSEPTYSAVSDGGEYLYVGLEGASSIRRLTLPGLDQDISIPMGSYPQGPLFAGEILALPGQPNSIAVLRNAAQHLSAAYDLTVFDDAVPRPDAVNFVGQFATASIQFGATPAVIYGGDGTISTMSLDANGATLESVAEFSTGGLSPGRIRFDDGVLYTDRGLAIDPVAGALVGTYPMEPGEFGMSVVPASDLNRVFILVNDSSQFIRSYDLATFAPVAEIPLGGVEFPINQQLRMIRWGEDGLALPTGDGRVLLINGPFVKP